MTLIDAILHSNSWMAQRQNDRGHKRKIVVKYLGAAPINPGHFRIVRSATDPTVDGKLSARQLTATDWEPVNLEAR